MKMSTIFGICVVVFCVVAVPSIAVKIWTRIETGKVVTAEPDGKIILVQEGRGSSRHVVRVVVDTETKLRVHGRSIPMRDLPQEVKVSDLVLVRFSAQNNLHAGRITKK